MRGSGARVRGRRQGLAWRLLGAASVPCILFTDVDFRGRARSGGEAAHGGGCAKRRSDRWRDTARAVRETPRPPAWQPHGGPNLYRASSWPQPWRRPSGHRSATSPRLPQVAAAAGRVARARGAPQGAEDQARGGKVAGAGGGGRACVAAARRTGPMALPLALLLRFAFLELFGICSVLIVLRHAAVKSAVEDLGR